MAESFFATLKCELLEGQFFPTRAQARMEVFDFIEGFYNTERRHSALQSTHAVRGLTALRIVQALRRCPPIPELVGLVADRAGDAA